MNFRLYCIRFCFGPRRWRYAGSAGCGRGPSTSPGANFNQPKLDKIGEFFRQRSPTRNPGRILLIQQHGKPVYHEFLRVRDTETKRR